MRAIILNRNQARSFPCFDEDMPVGMLPVVNKPLLEHQIEQLVQAGIKDIVICLHESPDHIEKYFRNGQRWGVGIQYEFLNPALNIHKIIHRLKHFVDQETLIYPDDVYFSFNLKDALALYDPKKTDLLVIISEDSQVKGYGFLKFFPEEKRILSYSPRQIQGQDNVNMGIYIVSPDLFGVLGERGTGCNLEDLFFSEKAVSSGKIFGYRQGHKGGRINDLNDLMTISRDFLNNEMHDGIIPGLERDPGIWIGRHCRVNARAKINPPVLIGDHVMVSDSVELGPYAVIGDNVIVDRHVRVSHSILFPYSYVGSMTEIDKKIVNKHRLVDYSNNASTRIDDPVLFGDLEENFFDKFMTRFLSVSAAVVLLFLLSPVIIFWCFLRVLASEKIWKQGERYKELKSGYLLIQRFPRLLRVIKGEMNFIGNRLKAPKGVITPLDILEAEKLSDEEVGVIENYYALTRNWKMDFLVALRFFRLIKNSPV